jgi:hypothetical protein
MDMGIYRRLESPLDITTSTIIRRIVSNHEAYQVTTIVLDQITLLSLVLCALNILGCINVIFLLSSYQ